jgi:hypothetical protein
MRNEANVWVSVSAILRSIRDAPGTVMSWRSLLPPMANPNVDYPFDRHVAGTSDD